MGYAVYEDSYENTETSKHYEFITDILIDIDKAKAELNTFKSQFDLLTDQIEEKVQQAFSYKYIAGGYQETIEELINLQYQYKQLEMDYMQKEQFILVIRNTERNYRWLLLLEYIRPQKL